MSLLLGKAPQVSSDFQSGDPKTIFLKKTLPEKNIVILFPFNSPHAKGQEKVQNNDIRDKNSSPGIAIRSSIWGKSLHSSGVHFLQLKKEGFRLDDLSSPSPNPMVLEEEPQRVRTHKKDRSKGTSVRIHGCKRPWAGFLQAQRS